MAKSQKVSVRLSLGFCDSIFRRTEILLSCDVERNTFLLVQLLIFDEIFLGTGVFEDSHIGEYPKAVLGRKIVNFFSSSET